MCGFAEPSDFATTSCIPNTSQTALTAPPAIIPVPGDAGFNIRRTAPYFISILCGIVPFIKCVLNNRFFAFSVKEDLRDRICAYYGVSKIFMADNSTSGGLNNEGMQILVTNRAVEMAQNVYNHYEEAVLEYSYIVNLHQARNSLGSALGADTGSFDHKGTISGTINKSTKYVWFLFSKIIR